MSSKSNGMQSAGQARAVNVKEAAQRMGLSPHTLNKWRSRGEGPAYNRLGAAIRYDLDEVERFMDERRVTPWSTNQQQSRDAEDAGIGAQVQQSRTNTRMNGGTQ